jgi:RNA 3'-terminal phosphate cyclase-like protein
MCGTEQVKKRGAAPAGGGEVLFKCGVVAALKPITLLEEGRVKRIRGVAYTTRCSPQMGNRMVDKARSILNNFIPDVYIYTDHYKGKDSGL